MTNNCDCNYNLYKFKDSSCRGCSYIQRGIRSAAPPSQKQIWNQTGISSSLHSMNLSSFVVSKQRLHSGKTSNWNQMSDRQIPGVQRVIVPSRGSSTKGNVTRMRPGSLAPGGSGVDVKNGSYDRHLALKKSYNLKQGIVPTIGAVKPVRGNKTYATNAVAGSDKCVCIDLPSFLQDALLAFNPPYSAEAALRAYNRSSSLFTTNTDINGLIVAANILTLYGQPVVTNRIVEDDNSAYNYALTTVYNKYKTDNDINSGNAIIDAISLSNTDPSNSITPAGWAAASAMYVAYNADNTRANAADAAVKTAGVGNNYKNAFICAAGSIYLIVYILHSR